MIIRSVLWSVVWWLVSFGSSAAGEPQVLAPGVISTEDHVEFGLALSPGGDAAYFTRDRDIYVARRSGDRWLPAEPVPWNSEAFDGDPFVTADGKSVLFMSSRPGSSAGPGQVEKLRSDVWIVDRLQDGSWGEPRKVEGSVNTPDVEGHASLSDQGTLYYFSSRADGLGGHDVYRARATPEGFGPPENLGKVINSEAGDGHPYIAPDESFLLFYSDRPGGFGSCDLYISLRQSDGWSEPHNLGPEINTTDCDMTPHVSRDGQQLYFARIDDDGGRDLYVTDFDPEQWRARKPSVEPGADSDGRDAPHTRPPSEAP